MLFRSSGDYTNSISSLTEGSGIYRLGGNWTNNGIFNHDLSTVVFNGSAEQLITKPTPETFYNLSIENTGALSGLTVRLQNLVQVIGTLYMKTGNITATGYKLQIVNQAAVSLNYTSTTKSRIFGQFERGVGQAASYLFPLGNITRPEFYNPATLITNVIPTTVGSVLAEFLPSPTPIQIVPPLIDAPVEVDSVYSAGYWSMTARNQIGRAHV